MSEIQDKVLICQRCNLEFTFSVFAQAFLRSRQLQPPTWCKTCQRKMRRFLEETSKK